MRLTWAFHRGYLSANAISLVVPAKAVAAQTGP